MIFRLSSQRQSLSTRITSSYYTDAPPTAAYNKTKKFEGKKKNHTAESVSFLNVCLLIVPNLAVLIMLLPGLYIRVL